MPIHCQVAANLVSVLARNCAAAYFNVQSDFEGSWTVSALLRGCRSALTELFILQFFESVYSHIAAICP